MITHGLTKSRTYTSWASMKNRCFSSTAPNYWRYGGKGLKVCERWQSFENFLEDMGERPAGTSIDRIDRDKGYEPGNCRWATSREQSLNRSIIKLSEDDVREILELRDEGMAQAEISRQYGCSQATVSMIIRGLRWPHISKGFFIRDGARYCRATVASNGSARALYRKA